MTAPAYVWWGCPQNEVFPHEMVSLDDPAIAGTARAQAARPVIPRGRFNAQGNRLRSKHAEKYNIWNVRIVDAIRTGPRPKTVPKNFFPSRKEFEVWENGEVYRAPKKVDEGKPVAKKCNVVHCWCDLV